MADEKPTEIVAPVAPIVKAEEAPKHEEPPIAAPVKKSEPDELAATVDQFFVGVQAIGLQSVRSVMAQLKKKADDVMTKLDGGASDEPPKKQG